jgi:hypothetical protein
MKHDHSVYNQKLRVCQLIKYYFFLDVIICDILCHLLFVVYFHPSVFRFWLMSLYHFSERILYVNTAHCT